MLFRSGLDTKLWYTRLLIKASDELFYQYMERGSVVYAGLFKDFVIHDNPARGNLSISTSLSAGYSFGNMIKGAYFAPANKFMVIPDISLKWNKRNLSFSMGMEYMESPFYRVGPVWLRAGCSYNLYFDKVRKQVKTLKW